MEAISLHPGATDLQWQRNKIDFIAMSAMERGVEARHLGQVGTKRGDDLDRLQVVRLVQGRKRAQRRELRDHLRARPHRLRELQPAVNDAMADGDELVVAALSLQELDQMGDGAGMIQLAPLAPCLCADFGALRVLGDESRCRADAFDLPLQQRVLVVRDVEDAELEAR